MTAPTPPPPQDPPASSGSPAAAPPLPEVRQCVDINHPQYGAVAVGGGVNPARPWGVMHNQNGGYWATDDEVADWKVLA